MSGKYSKYIKPIHFLGDFIVINFAFIISFYIKFHSLNSFIPDHYPIILFFFDVSWMIATYILASYNLYRVMGNEKVITEIIKLLVFHFLMVAALIGITHAYSYSRQVLLFSYVIIGIMVPLWRLIIIYFLKLYRISGGNYKRVIIVGWGDSSIELRDFFDSHPEYGYRFLGFFNDQQVGNHLFKGTLNDIDLFAIENKVDEIYCSISELNNDQIQKIIDFADKNLIRVKLLPESKEFYYKNFKTDFYEHLPVLIFRSIPLDNVVKKNAKRTFDILFSLLVILLILSWLIPIIALLIKLDSKGPIFFKQKRSGINNNDFWCWKLRSMHVKNNEGFKQATKNDSRITRIGKYIRKFNLDELPQFYNVLIGNMSVVGPRPHPIELNESYKDIIDKYMVRHFIKPGITGLSQVMGYRGETSDSSLMKNRVRIDIFYIENWTLLLDVKIVFMTVGNMFKGDEKAF